MFAHFQAIADYLKRLQQNQPQQLLPFNNPPQFLSNSQLNPNLNQDSYTAFLDNFMPDWPASVIHEFEGVIEMFDLPADYDIMLYNRSLSCFVLEIGQSISLRESERSSGALIEYQGKVHKIDHINTGDYSKPRIYLKLLVASDRNGEGEDNGSSSS